MSPNRNRDLTAMGVAIFIPTAVTWIYFVMLADANAASQQLAYSIGKSIQFGLPFVWMLLFYRPLLKTLWPTTVNQQLIAADQTAADQTAADQTAADQTGSGAPNFTWTWGWALGFGLLAGASIFVGYYGVVEPMGLADTLIEKVKAKVAGMSLLSPTKFIALGLFYALVHSFMEEYYWRWFVYGVLRKWTPKWFANLTSSVGFSMHHVILLGTFLGWSSPLTYAFSAAIALGGSVWAWTYGRSGQLAPSWVSHMIVDAAIFALGFVLVFGG